MITTVEKEKKESHSAHSADKLQPFWKVASSFHGIDLLSFLHVSLAIHGTFSKKSIKKGIDQGACSVNNVVVRKSTMAVVQGDVIRLAFLPESRKDKNDKISFEKNSLLYEDEWFFAISKPAKVPTTHGAIDTLVRQIKGYDSGKKIHLVHRLDQDTTGVVLLAKSRDMALKLEHLFKEREVDKTYIAIVDGTVRQTEGKIVLPLVKGKGLTASEIHMRVASDNERGALSAETRWKTMIVNHTASLLSVVPKTGRTHQIRVHLASIAHPILGDSRYTVFRARQESFYPQRHMLHAVRISFLHPMTKKIVVVHDPIPEDMKFCICRLFGSVGESIICAL